MQNKYRVWRAKNILNIQKNKKKDFIDKKLLVTHYNKYWRSFFIFCLVSILIAMRLRKFKLFKICSSKLDKNKIYYGCMITDLYAIFYIKSSRGLLNYSSLWIIIKSKISISELMICSWFMNKQIGRIMNSCKIYLTHSNDTGLLNACGSFFKQVAR